MISSQRAQLVQETRNQRVTNLAKIQHKREMDQYSLAERSREIRTQEKIALKRRDILKKNQQKELIRNAREHLAQEHQKKVRPGASSFHAVGVYFIELACALQLMSEKKIQQMEAEEVQLLEKLRITQEMQRAAYEHLEFVMQDEL